MDSVGVELRIPFEHFYDSAKSDIIKFSSVMKIQYITSRSTEESLYNIELICTSFEKLCKECAVPIEGVFLKKTELSVKVFKYLICNTNFNCQTLLSNDTGSGHLVPSHASFSTYLLVEILWHLHFDDILAESMLHFPLDLCVEIAEILPRCLDLLDFQRAIKFLTTFIQNTYKKLIILKDVGCQIKNCQTAIEQFVGNLQELILQFTNKRVFMLTDGPVEERYKRCGILLKKILQMTKICFSYKSKKFEVPTEMQNLYQLTFGNLPFQLVDATVIDQHLTKINQGLIRLLLQKVKEIDCNIYLNWTEYDDEENTSLCLQRAIGLECYFFIESTKEFIDCDNKDFIHLTECLQQLASKPDPKNSVESLHLTDLCQGLAEGKKECVITLFKRYKEWDNSILDSVDSNIFLIDKEICEQLFDHLAVELCNTQDPNDLEKLQLYTFSLARAFISLNITQVYEIAVKFILHFGENTTMKYKIDILNFEKFIIHNPNLSNAKNLRVVMFFLCLKTVPALKILLKMAIGHSDYPDVAVSIDDLMILLPILKIRTETMLEEYRAKLEEKRGGLKLPPGCIVSQKPKKEPPKRAPLALRVLQEICLEGPKWNPNKFSDLIQAMYSFSTATEVINEIFTPFLMMELRPLPYLKPILVEIHKVIGNCCGVHLDAINSLYKQGLGLLNSNEISRYIVDELQNLIIEINKHRYSCIRNEDKYRKIVGERCIFLNPSQCLDHYSFLHQNKTTLDTYMSVPLHDNDVQRQFFLKCTKKSFLESLEFMITGKRGEFKFKSKADACESTIRLTFENCLLCLEYPQVAPPDSISYMLRRLIDVLPLMIVRKKKTNFISGVCENLKTYAAILKPSIEFTAVSEAYSELVKKWEESTAILPAKLAALEQFASSCSQESEKLKVFTGPHSPQGLKLWLVHDTLTALVDENVNKEDYIKKLDEYFK